MKFLFASDSFKGSLSSLQTSRLLTQAAREFFPDCQCICTEVADGGEGTVDAVLSAARGERITLPVQGPLHDMVTAQYGILPGRKAVIEMASASGLPLIPPEKRNPLLTSTYGTGQLILDALNRGINHISIAVGGSATNDGGMGCLRALGARFLDGNGKPLRGCGKDLIQVETIDLSGLDPRIQNTTFTVMCDVTNPFCGENGAALVFGKQKGGTPQILKELEAGMLHFCQLVKKQFSIDLNQIPSSGAAGGLGGALCVFLNGRIQSGITTVLDLIHFDEKLKDVSLVITGEGCTDRQSVSGKVVQGIGDRCHKHGIPVIALSGSMGDGAQEIYRHGVSSVFTTVNRVMTLEEAMEQAETLYLDGARRLFRILKTGMEMLH